MNKRIRITFALLSVVAVIAVVVVLRDQRPVSSGDSVQVVASFYPLSFLAEQIGGPNATVVNLTPAGAEPHDYELSPGDLVALQSADIVLLNGAHLEPWSDSVLADLPPTTQVLVMADLLDPNTQRSFGSASDDEHESGTDPHFWLDPVLYQQEAALVRDSLVVADPAHAADYSTRYDALIGQLNDLDASYQRGLASCENRSIVVSHDAFGYLGDRYELNVLPISGISPDEEPSPRRLGDIATFVKEKKVSHIFFETLVSPRLAETIAKETGAHTLVLNPLEGITGEERNNGVTYISVMRDNLTNLQQAMVCSPKNN